MDGMLTQALADVIQRAGQVVVDAGLAPRHLVGHLDTPQLVRHRTAVPVLAWVAGVGQADPADLDRRVVELARTDASQPAVAIHDADQRRLTLAAPRRRIDD